MNAGLHSLRRAVEDLFGRWRQPVPSPDGQPANGHLRVTSLPGRWPDAESVLARRLPTVASSETAPDQVDAVIGYLKSLER